MIVVPTVVLEEVDAVLDTSTQFIRSRGSLTRSLVPGNVHCLGKLTSVLVATSTQALSLLDASWRGH